MKLFTVQQYFQKAKAVITNFAKRVRKRRRIDRNYILFTCIIYYVHEAIAHTSYRVEREGLIFKIIE